MANYASLKATIDAQIKANGNQEITGPILNAVLTAMINTIGNGYALQGSVAQTTDNPGAPDNPVAYLAAGPGTYTNFGGTVIPDDGHAYLLKWDTAWAAVQLPIATFNLVNGKQDQLTFDNAPTPGSTNPVTSDGIATALDGKIDKVPDALTGEIPVFDGDGGIEGSNKFIADFATQEDLDDANARINHLAGEAGLAEAVIDTDGAGTEQEFTFRKSGGDGGAYYRKIKGKTLAWNQLVNPANFRASEGSFTDGVKYVNNGDGSYSIIVDTGGATADCQIEVSTIATPSTTKRIYVLHNDKALSGSTIFFSTGYSSLTQDTIIPAGTSAVYNSIVVKSGCPAGTYTFAPQIYNLTLSGIADEISTPADFKALYPDIYGYNPGTLISNDAEAVETTGVNQWDEEWESGYIDSYGDDAPFASRIRSKNYIPIVNGQTYYLKSSYSVYPCYYDADKNYISQESISGSRAFTPPANAAFMRIWVYNLSTYNHDICINLSNAAINGQYFPHWKRTLQLGITTRKDTDGNVPFPNGLQSCPVAQDEATKEGGTIRVGTRAYQAGDENDADVITDGTNTNYALTTPQTFTWAEPLNLGVRVDENGTEKAVAPEGATAPSAPFVADTTYTMSIARMVAILQGI